jgi:hypothetical protein
VLQLLEEIEKQSRRSDAITCKKYLAWMTAHDGMAPLEIRKAATDAEVEENNLRTKYLYLKRLKRKDEVTPEVRGLVARIEELTQTEPDKNLVIAVEAWCASHDYVLPQEYKYGTDNDTLKARWLGQRYRSLKRRKNEVSPEVLEIIDRIEKVKKNSK